MNDVPRTTTAFRVVKSPRNVGAVVVTRPAPVNVAASPSYKIAVYPNGAAFKPSVVVTAIGCDGVEVAL